MAAQIPQAASSGPFDLPFTQGQPPDGGIDAFKSIVDTSEVILKLCITHLPDSHVVKQKYDEKEDLRSFLRKMMEVDKKLYEVFNSIAVIAGNATEQIPSNYS